MKKHYDPYKALRVMFEDTDDFTDLLPNERRVIQLITIYEYAIAYGFQEAAIHAIDAKKTTENVYDILLEVGLLFDGKKLCNLNVEDKIYSVPSTKSSRNSSFTKRQLHLNETNDDPSSY
jgi:hypothetical protein